MTPKTYTLIIKEDKPYLRECATMMPPDHRDFATFDKTTGNKKFTEAHSEYLRHLASLKEYPLLSMPSSWKQGDEIKEDMVIAQKQVGHVIGLNPLRLAWSDATPEDYWEKLLPEYRRIVFTPSEQQGSGGEETIYYTENCAGVYNKNTGDIIHKFSSAELMSFYKSRSTPAVSSTGVLDAANEYAESLYPLKDENGVWECNHQEIKRHNIAYAAFLAGHASSVQPVGADEKANIMTVFDVINKWANDNERETVPRKAFLQIATSIATAIAGHASARSGDEVK